MRFWPAASVKDSYMRDLVYKGLAYGIVFLWLLNLAKLAHGDMVALRCVGVVLPPIGAFLGLL